MAKPTRFRDKWRARWTDETGKRRSEFFDDYREALHALKRHEVEVGDVRRGRRNAAPPDRVFGDLCDEWISQRASQKRSGKGDESIIRCHLRPFFGAMKVRHVGTAQADAFALSPRHLDKKTISNLLTLLIAMLNYARDRECREGAADPQAGRSRDQRRLPVAPHAG